MTQFVFSLKNCSSIWSSIKEIFGQEGLFGFFSGLIPKLICDVTCIALTSTTCYLVNKYYISDQGNRTYFAGFIQFVYASFLYPIQVVSTCMVVTGSRYNLTLSHICFRFYLIQKKNFFFCTSMHIDSKLVYRHKCLYTRTGRIV